MVQNGVTNGFRGKETIKLSQELNELLNLSIQDREIPQKKSQRPYKIAGARTYYILCKLEN